MSSLPPKRPTETRLYEFDFGRQLAGDTISTFTLSVTAGSVTASGQENTDCAVTALLAGGTEGGTSTIEIQITTAAGQILIRDYTLLTTSASNSFAGSTTTKGQVEDMAFEEIGLAGYAFDATADEQASGLRRLDALMRTWTAMGLTVGYNYPTTVGGSLRTDPSGIPDFALDAVVVSLAISLAPAIGKTMSTESRFRYQQSMTAIRAAFARIPERVLPFSTIRGAGAKPLSTWRPYQTPVRSSSSFGIAGLGEGDVILGTEDGGLLGG